MGTPTPVETFRREVHDNILRQPLGVPAASSGGGEVRPPLAPPGATSTVADLSLPHELLSRITDRIIQSSYRETFRAVINDIAFPLRDPGTITREQPTLSELIAEVQLGVPLPANIKLLPGSILENDPLHRSPEARPVSRGFKLTRYPQTHPTSVGQIQTDTAPEQEAAAWIHRRLAVDGLIRTLAGVIAILGHDRFDVSLDDGLSTLTRLGFPVDLLDHVSSSACPQGARSVIAKVASLVRDAAPARADLSTLRFQFSPTSDRFRPDSDAGEQHASLVRLQITRGEHWIGAGSGDNLDLVQSLLHQLPSVPVVASVEARHLQSLLRTIVAGILATNRELTIIVEPLPVSQWARDNAWPGVESLTDSNAADLGPTPARSRRAVLVPRFASRGDDGSVFVPGENALLRTLPASGIECYHSPLLFQGGNLLLVPDPLATHPDSSHSPRLLLIGEAEIARNVALGLTPTEATEALRIEFAADRAAVLPSVSYHIDYEVSIRVKPGLSPDEPRVIAFVNDSEAAVRLILECGINLLESKRLLTKPRVKSARNILRSARWHDLIDLIQSSVFLPAIISRGEEFGFRTSFAQAFSDQPGDNGIGNLYAFVQAFDIMATWLDVADELLEPPAQVVRNASRRRDADRVLLHKQLDALGFVVVPVPSMSDAERGINYINGIHFHDRTLIPTWGGMYTPLDVAAISAYQNALGSEIAVHGIPSAESQRRNGSLRCSTSIFHA